MKIKQLLVLFFLFLYAITARSADFSWTGKRITAETCQNESNTWMSFRRDVDITRLPDKIIARIACDSKYWMWINGELVVFEGQLKRGPTPEDTYCDEVDISPFVKKGKNTIAILTWYFGKDGFSHKSSGQAGLAFDCPAIELYSDERWLVRLEDAFEKTNDENPNYRLSESNIRFNANKGDFEWIVPQYETKNFKAAIVIGEAEDYPWNRLFLRPIPLFKNYGIRKYENDASLPSEGTGDWIICKLPYNCHVTPILDVEAPKDALIRIQTDNFDYMGLRVASVRAEYLTKEGKQKYESLGWMNGHIVKYFIPKGIKINSLSYRETGYNCDFSGSFKCDNLFYNKLWTMAQRTLYVTMRDTYMDCPDRERAQWWGDVVNESGEAFYALSPDAAHITKKGMLELINWQRKNGVIYSPVPEGNWSKELPGQMLASIGYYGFWNYYLNTGDKETIAKVIDGVRRYLDVWKLDENGILIAREGEWYWGDWGDRPDKQLLFNAWYFLALKGYRNMAEVLDKKSDVKWAEDLMGRFKVAFNSNFWDGKGYRTSKYEGEYDDRGQALAVVSGLADEEKYKAITRILDSSFLASPYMEKYVLEALFVMGEDKKGLERMKKRYYNMVLKSPFTTLYENFGDDLNNLGFGTNNHAWSGGGLTVLAQYVCGISPLEAAWKHIKIKPMMGDLVSIETSNETVAGRYFLSIKKAKKQICMELTVPLESKVSLFLPSKEIAVNGTKYSSGVKKGKCYVYQLQGGKYIVKYNINT